MKCEPGKAKRLRFEKTKDGVEVLKEVLAWV
jgi:hypothetical protein